MEEKENLENHRVADISGYLSHTQLSLPPSLLLLLSGSLFCSSDEFSLQAGIQEPIVVVPVYLQILGPGMGVRCEGGVFKGALRAYLAKNERHTAGWGGKEEEPEV